MKRSSQILIILCLILLLAPTSSTAQRKQKILIDTIDNALDVSYYLNNLHGFLPIISPITEPAVGYGAAVAGLFFISKKTDGKEFTMPDVVGAAGGITSNKTWFAGAGYAGFWKGDRIRYRGAFGYGDIKLKYYGTGNGYLDKHPAKFNLNSYFLLQQAIFRIGKSRFMLGGKYQLMKTAAVFFEESDIPWVDPVDLELVNSGVGLIAEYENFNNIFSPSKGLRFNLTYDQFLKILGSDKDFGKFTFFLHYYQPIIKNAWTAGFRIESQLATGNSPFYMMPFVYLRGVPAMRYQGEFTALVETEQEVTFTRRWSIVGFGGYGKAYESLEKMDENSSPWNAGAGFRYLIARLFGLKMGLDIARGPEQWAVYVVIGTAWIK